VTADPENTTGGAASSAPEASQPPTDAPGAAETPAAVEAAAGDGGQPKRRIAIGTQREGVAQPRVSSRHVLVGSKPAVVAPPAAAAGPAAEAPADSAAPGSAAPGSAAPGSAAPGSAPTGSAAESPASQDVGTPEPAAEQGGAAAPESAPPLGPRGESGGPRRGKRSRDRRRGDTGPSPFAVQVPSKLVAVPSLRQPLGDDLEDELEAALGDLEVDALLDSAASEKVDAPLAAGSRVTGKVVSLADEIAFLDLGGRRQGALGLLGLDPEEMPAVGDEIEVSIGTRNEEDGLYDVALGSHAVAVEDWSQLEAGMIVEGRVTGTNKGGLEVDVGGLRGFMPAGSVSTYRVEDFEEFVGQTLECLVTELVPNARRLVLSRRAVLERQAAEARQKLLETLEIGQTLEGIVRNIRDFGAFVDIGHGVDGLVHVSQLSWDRVEKPEDVLTLGQKVKVVVRSIDEETGKISLSARDLIDNPWTKADEKYPIGSTQRGTVSRIAQFGAFVKLEPGVEGLVHVSELAHRHVHRVGDIVKEGEQVECKVISVDTEEQRMSLSLKATIPAPVSAAEQAAAEAEQEAENEPPPPPYQPKSNKPLKGGLGEGPTGERFGLKW
jgi:predicted RNA-binding protein with RPS1 domain